MAGHGRERAGEAAAQRRADSRVHIAPVAGWLELRFDRGFQRADLEAVKAIPGRWWQHERRVWLLPHSDVTLDALHRGFGARLVLPASLQQGAAQPPAPRPEESAPAATTQPMTHAAALAALRQAIRVREYSPKTERAYSGWVRRFLAFLEEKACLPHDATPEHVVAFLARLAERDQLAARSRNQAASAIGFMFREVLGHEDPLGIARAKGPHRMPLVLSHREVLCVLRELTGKYFLIGVLLYSAGLRVEECLRLRVKDVDFELRQILVRDGKGRKDRYVPLAGRAVALLRAQIARIRDLHARDRAAGHGWAALPGALHRKDPNAGYELSWQWIFPASSVNADPATGRFGRWPLHTTAVQREIKRAVRSAGIPKRATCHTFRHSFATEALRGGCDIRTLQKVLGHKDIRTTTIYLHVIEQTGLAMRSPLDRPDDPEDISDGFDALDDLRIGAPGSAWELGARQWSARAAPRPTPARSPTQGP
jgi:integron integrase